MRANGTVVLPYGYKLENGDLVIAEDEVEVIRVIYDRYIHTNEGCCRSCKISEPQWFCKETKTE